MSPKKGKKQTALGAFNFTRSVMHRGKLTQTKVSTEVKKKKLMSIKCSLCPKLFKNKQGLGTHKKCCHLAKQQDSDSDTPKLIQKLPSGSKSADETREVKLVVESLLDKVNTHI